MKLASLVNPSRRDGDLIVVSRDNKRAVKADGIAPSLREALEDWGACESKLQALSEELNSGSAKGAFDVDESKLHSPLPRTFQWADGSAFIHHIRLVRKSRNAEPPETLLTVPLMYQGGSDDFLAPRADIPQIDSSHGTDFEGEVAVDEFKQGFGFFQGKPSSAFGPFAVTPDELGEAWKEGRLHLPLLVTLNGEFFGNAEAGAMHFNFGQLIAHAARTRNLKAGAIIGSGTVSNEGEDRGSSCILERRMIEKINEGTIKTPFLKPGDVMKIEMKDSSGNSIFGTIEQKVVKYEV